MNDTAKHILAAHSFVITRARLAILDIFLHSKEAMNLSILEKKVGDRINRVTIYRILRGFTRSGLLYVVPSTDGTVRYALHLSNPFKNPLRNTHFLCYICGRISLLDEVPLPKMIVPESYTVETLVIFVKGICNDCRHEQDHIHY